MGFPVRERVPKLPLLRRVFIPNMLQSEIIPKEIDK